MSSCWLLLKFQIWQRSKTFTQPWGWLNFSTRQLPSNRRNVICLSLYYRYIHSRCLGELQYLVLKVQTFTAMTPPPPLRHVWARAAQSSDRVQKCLRSYLAGQLFSTLQLFFRQRNVTRLFVHYRYIHDRCSGELKYLLPPVQTFKARTWHARYGELTNLPSLRIPF